MRDIAFLVYPGYSLMALAIVAGFEVANSMEGGPFYDLHFVSEKGGPVRTSAGMMLQTEIFTDKPFDTLVVGGATIPEPVFARSNRVHARCAQASPANSSGVHGSVRTRRGRVTRRTPRDNALDARAGTATDVSKGEDG